MSRARNKRKGSNRSRKAPPPLARTRSGRKRTPKPGAIAITYADGTTRTAKQSEFDSKRAAKPSS